MVMAKGAPSHAEVQNIVSKGIEDYDDRVSLPRHQENQLVQKKTLEMVTEVRDWMKGWEAILKYRDNRTDNRRDWLAPILAAVVAAAAVVILTLVFSKPH